jgi:hypothetical protein
VDVLVGVVRNVVTLWSWFRLHKLERLGHLLVGCPSLFRSAQGG